jgi:hypothetical protein
VVGYVKAEELNAMLRELASHLTNIAKRV